MNKIFTNALLCISLTALPLAAADISGTWLLDGQVSDVPVKRTCTLKQEGSKLTGMCKSADGVEAPVEGEVSEQKVKFQYNADYQGTTYTLKYAGIMDSDTAMKGDIDAGAASGSFTGKKE